MDILIAINELQTNVSWNVSDVTTLNNIVNNKSEENIKTKQETEFDTCVTIRDASFSWPNSKVPSLTVDYLNIEEGTTATKIVTKNYFSFTNVFQEN